MSSAQVGIIMGSQSDLNIMEEAAKFLKSVGITYEINIISAHRAPDVLADWVRSARERGMKVIIAGAGGAAHLPGVTAAFTTLPVIGVPVRSRISIDGWDSILSILQMPSGVPVATVALDAAKNAGILAAQIIGTADESIAEKLDDFKVEMRQKVLDSAKELRDKGH
ncbi:MAG: 5-(carboxyamino)imidazole ribonucleotide mutase [Cytophagales bacterium]|nr:5-(carboxyamino)imidazole ribonucleotide mutase [Cytophagales bacterium]